MQRNMDLVRMILMRIEDRPSEGAVPPFGIVGYAPEQVRYHAHIMREEGLIEGSAVADMRRNKGLNIPGPEATPLALTWKGHEFLDLARDQARWNKAKAIIGRVGSAPLAVWTTVLNDLLLKELSAAS